MIDELKRIILSYKNIEKLTESMISRIDITPLIGNCYKDIFDCIGIVTGRNENWITQIIISEFGIENVDSSIDAIENWEEVPRSVFDEAYNTAIAKITATILTMREK